MFEKVLVANRGEIALRVIKSIQSSGFTAVAVFSDADRNALHVQAADEAVYIGPANVADSYLNIDRILDAARKTGADAIHPGYGFLSENAEFAKQCQAQNIKFIGPSPAAIELMGNKRAAKVAMLEADVPCVPGYEGQDQSDENLTREAQRIGFPLMIKASAGGGGRGMRLVNSADELIPMLKTARSEARNAFGDDDLILERAIISPRHIEIQVIADQHGNTLYLNERDCSIQRRHQKVVEEAPSPFVDSDLRRKMGEAAVRVAKSCQYEGAGTVEFLVDEHKNFYFLEMNTRLQVEHPVTELITGLDLVALQLDIALGLTLPLAQNEVALNGHAIEVRLYAEDPSQNFMPQTGEICSWMPLEGEGIRIDCGIAQSDHVSPHYDPMLAKLITWGKNREEARRRLLRTVQQTRLLGVTHNLQFLGELLAHPEFAKGNATTAFINEHESELVSLHERTPDEISLGLAAIILNLQHTHASGALPQERYGSIPELFRFTRSGGGQEPAHQLAIRYTPEGYEVKHQNPVVEGSEQQPDTSEITGLKVVSLGSDYLDFIHNDVRKRCHYNLDGQSIWLHLDGVTQRYSEISYAPPVTANGAGSGKIQAPMDGAVVDVQVKPGDTVSRGQLLVVIEAMKMEHPIKADVDGVVSECDLSIGQQVKSKQVLITINKAE
ncbi:methylcrotonoyl-coenzyme A carboxylase 1 (alpha) [Oleiphilus messinensis]|uniref:Biotin carboxylase n=1 Tax=Oleiphilus messinensis TaxID=141451 RepID=A0A1Y0I5Z9_9GAMM|nr:acetyl/propionyl/methylcrotonyl-CoA carboxylase subunit alpha [Oleiphilus messinensis]ARU55841.1 methylcrotonoyl-coenzyme A carboxylase 1 (alpha) [Oleiphilus messinensis]